MSVNHVRLTDHARERIIGRKIPHRAIWGALDRPFTTRPLPGGREVRTVPARLRSRRAWVSVVVERMGPDDVRVITAYPRGHR